MPVHDLKILDGVFDVDDAAAAVFHIDRSRLDELFHLLAAQVERRAEFPGRPAVDEAVPVGFDLFPE